MTYEHFEHGADIGVRGLGATPAEAFEGAASALCALLCEDLTRVRPAVEERIVCEATGLEELLVAFLNELIFRLDARRLVFGRFAVSIDDPAGPVRDSWRLEARAWGESIDPARHESTVEPKGATFTELRVAQGSGGWVAQCVVDV